MERRNFSKFKNYSWIVFSSATSILKSLEAIRDNVIYLLSGVYIYISWLNESKKNSKSYRYQVTLINLTKIKLWSSNIIIKYDVPSIHHLKIASPIQSQKRKKCKEFARDLLFTKLLQQIINLTNITYLPLHRQINREILTKTRSDFYVRYKNEEASPLQTRDVYIFEFLQCYSWRKHKRNCATKKGVSMGLAYLQTFFLDIFS